MTTTPAVRFENGTYEKRYAFLGDECIGSTGKDHRTGGRQAFSVRTGFLPGTFPDDQAAADALVAAFGPAPHEAGEVHRETYRGIEWIVVFRPGGSEIDDASGRGHTWSDLYTLIYNGRVVTCPKGTVDTINKKVRGWIDTEHSDKEVLPKLLPLVDARMSVEGLPGWDNGATPKIGDVAYVYAMGRFRRGLVTKVAKTRTTVSYTTASSQGRVFHKAAKHEDLAVG